MTDAPNARWKRRKDARPAEILDSALTVFAERGFAATRMDDIAARAGVTKGTIYLYFRSKEAVFKSLVQESLGAAIEVMRDNAARFEGPAPDLLRTILRGIGRFVCASDRAALPKIILAESGNFPHLVEFYRREVVDRGLALLQSVIRRGIERGEFRTVEPGHAARLCVAPLLMAAVWRTTFAQFDSTPYDLNGLVETHIDVLLTGLAAERKNPA
jgi:AcrR family transcriptional regulator